MFQYTNFNSEKWEFRSHGVKDSYCIIREKLLHFDVKKSCMLIASIEMFETHVVTLWQHWLRHNSNASQCRIFIKVILVHTCSNQHLIITIVNIIQENSISFTFTFKSNIRLSYGRWITYNFSTVWDMETFTNYTIEIQCI